MRDDDLTDAREDVMENIVDEDHVRALLPPHVAAKLAYLEEHHSQLWALVVDASRRQEEQREALAHILDSARGDGWRDVDADRVRKRVEVLEQSDPVRNGRAALARLTDEVSVLTARRQAAAQLVTRCRRHLGLGDR
jgi:hypothetical protein